MRQFHINTSISGEIVTESILLSENNLRQELEIAQNSTEAAKLFFRHVLLQLTKEQVDLDRAMKLLVKTVEFGRNARNILTKLVEQNPSNPQIIRAFGTLIRDVEHSNDEAELLFVQANAIEDENSTSALAHNLIEIKLIETQTHFKLTKKKN
ncbi:MAG: hypothetical protein EZS28_054975, partial [Streblomastix strix]